MKDIYKHYTMGEAEAHLNGLLEAAEVADMELCHNVARALRSMVTVRRATKHPVEPALKAAEVLPWCLRYWGSLKWPNGRVEASAEDVMRQFEGVDSFLGATPDELRAKPGCGPATLKALIVAQEVIANDKKTKASS